jgi:hypothetical protein
VKATVRAASADNDAVLFAVASAAEEQAKTELGKPEPAKPEAGKPEPAKAGAGRQPAASAAATQLAKVLPGEAQQAPVTAAAAPAESQPFLQRALSFVPLIGGSRPEASAEAAPVASVVPTSPTSVRAPLPPRRAGNLRTTRLEQPAAAFASQPVTR